ncbi:hypothetical protein [Methylocapsa palsarum]|uniref:Uncharacterized protein n=1 Tax=Methylocapsa palsarum TaxID=1612308 RepID=A0A1I3XFY1_9HYPH|nr:hypothetical protein [Methylocapsa palsarum]SFK18464.1 hypothetical protein SAMN05444581_103101 [Methylocapsa palsarum]
MTFLPRNILGISRLAGAAALALTLPLNSANAGFFDFLFQPQPATSASPMRPGPFPSDSGYRSAASRHKTKAVSLHRPKAVEKMHVAKVGGPLRPAPGLMDDDSLREGDAVMTHFGVRVFIGDAGRHHRAEDFASLSSIKVISKSARSALLAIDSRRASPNSVAALQSDVVTGRSVAEPQVEAGAMITDPKGNTIRYVGP